MVSIQLKASSCQSSPTKNWCVGASFCWRSPQYLMIPAGGCWWSLGQREGGSNLSVPGIPSAYRRAPISSPVHQREIMPNSIRGRWWHFYKSILYFIKFFPSFVSFRTGGNYVHAWNESGAHLVPTQIHSSLSFLCYFFFQSAFSVNYWTPSLLVLLVSTHVLFLAPSQPHWRELTHQEWVTGPILVQAGLVRPRRL